MRVECFSCWRKTDNVYYVGGIPLCSTCQTRSQADEFSCNVCGISSRTIPITTVHGTAYCIHCINRLPAQERKNVSEKSVFGALIEHGADKLFKPYRKDPYHIDKSPVPWVQSFIHLAVILLISVYALAQADLFLQIGGLLIAALLIVLLHTFATIRVKVFDDEIRCMYGFFTYVIRKGDIESAALMPPSRFVGYGVVFGWYGGLAIQFLTGNEPRILFKKKFGLFRSVLISTPEPAKLLEHIAKKM